jgi:uroporphyrinogen III methyltransferase/synthase
MLEAGTRRGRRSPLARVTALLDHDFPHVGVEITPQRSELESGNARACVVEAETLPDLPEAGWDHMAFPADSAADGLGLVFREGDRVLETLRRFYLPPVVFAGAGPGGEGLMTVAARRAVAAADVVLVDCLCGEDVLREARPDAAIVPVGKRCGKASAKQADINARMLAEVLRARKVVRLKGGDPSVFGRLEEEVSTLAARRLGYRVLPGIGAASAAAAFIGMPLTVREVASELVLSTGRFAGGGKNPFPLEGRAAPAIALYMSRKVLAERMRDLLAAGYPPATPVAVVEKLGSPEARSVGGTIETIADAADRADVGTPAVVLVGAQYGDAGTHLPLHGVRIWLPAEQETGETQREALEALGAVCVQEPLIEPVALPVPEGALLARPFEWVLFTSKKSVDFFFDLLAKWGHDARWLPKVAAIGDPAVEKLRARGIEPDLVPAEPTRKALVRSLLALGLQGQRVLIPASAVAPDHVREALAPHAAEVVRVDLYTLRFPEVASVPACDVVLFSSESTVRSAKANGLVEQLKRRGTLVGGIGPACWRTIEREGLPLSIVPDGTDPAALARATHRFFTRRDLAALQESTS